ncbi:MAG TPA: TlyA family RNA methyltransferase [Chloroflexota bacterium]|nr:TlyA family RNA methyltransferase [Chloroflexota bacterium]
MTAPARPAPASDREVVRDRSRLDLALVARGLAESREKAQALIVAGLVTVDGRPAQKSAELIGPDAALSVQTSDGFVSRGGEKLEHALQTFGIKVDGLVCLDAGASTGGFTDVLLRRGAERVYAVDVGHGQLDWRLREDSRVVVMERTNVRTLESLPEVMHVAVADLSFISLRLALPAISRLVQPDGSIVVLVKPQFEAGKDQVPRGGVVRDPATHRRVMLDLWAWALANRLNPHDLTPSPIRGPAGNVEFLLWLTNAPADPADVSASAAAAEALVSAALANVPPR